VLGQGFGVLSLKHNEIGSYLDGSIIFLKRNQKVKIVEDLVKKLKSRARKKKFEKMKQQLETPTPRRPAAKTVPKK